MNNHIYLKNDLERNKLEITQELEEQHRIISEATAYAKKLDTALSAVNLALGTMTEKSGVRLVAPTEYMSNASNSKQ